MSTPDPTQTAWTVVTPGSFRLTFPSGRRIDVEPDAQPCRRFTWRLTLHEGTRFEVLAEHVRDITAVMNEIEMNPAPLDRPVRR